MNDTNELLADRYRRIPYGEFTHPNTHPSHTGAVARLFGIPSPEPRTARILELATGRGSNLNWIAATLPEATCLGVDLVADGIDTARKVAADRGLSNVKFETADLLEFDFGHQQFDYIIAHGFMAWTPEPVQQRILEVCRDHLSDHGVALVSYNAMPGSATRDTLRRLFLLEMEQPDGAEMSPDDQLAALERVMDFFETSLPGMADLPHAAQLRKDLSILRSKPREVLLHDEAGVVSEPLYLLQFTQWAAETQLAYIADTDLRLDWLAALPQEVRTAIDAAGMPRLKALQYADYARHCPFRSSLLCRAALADHVRSTPDPAALRKLHVQSLLVPEGSFSATDDSPATFRVAGQPFLSGAPAAGRITTSSRVLKALLIELAQTSGSVTRFGEVYLRALANCDPKESEETLDVIARLVLESVCLGRMKLSTCPL